MRIDKAERDRRLIGARRLSTTELSDPKLPTITWVVGNNTDVGKTTVAAALISLLVSRDKSAVGFKPYSDARLQYQKEYFASFGEKFRYITPDSDLMSSVSDGTDDRWQEVMSPVTCVCYPNFEDVIFARVGSEHTGGAKFFRNSLGDRYLENPEFLEIAPPEFVKDLSDAISTDFNLFNMPLRFKDESRASFDFIANQWFSDIVFEGYGHGIPALMGSNRINHLLSLDATSARFYRNINIDLFVDSGAVSSRNFSNQMAQLPHISFQIPKFEPVELFDGLFELLDRKLGYLF